MAVQSPASTAICSRGNSKLRTHHQRSLIRAMRVDNSSKPAMHPSKGPNKTYLLIRKRS